MLNYLRALFFPPQLIESTIRSLLQWAIAYGSRTQQEVRKINVHIELKFSKPVPSAVFRRSSPRVAPLKHQLYYVVVQSALYAFCFTHKQILASKTKQDLPGWFLAMGFPVVCFSSLRPLQVYPFSRLWLTSPRVAMTLWHKNSLNLLHDLGYMTFLPFKCARPTVTRIDLPHSPFSRLTPTC